jgi:hypothetical protein
VSRERIIYARKMIIVRVTLFYKVGNDLIPPADKRGLDYDVSYHAEKCNPEHHDLIGCQGFSPAT